MRAKKTVLCFFLAAKRGEHGHQVFPLTQRRTKLCQKVLVSGRGDDVDFGLQGLRKSEKVIDPDPADGPVVNFTGGLPGRINRRPKW